LHKGSKSLRDNELQYNLRESPVQRKININTYTITT
jgi:hypothetical protein